MNVVVYFAFLGSNIYSVAGVTRAFLSVALADCRSPRERTRVARKPTLPRRRTRLGSGR